MRKVVALLASGLVLAGCVAGQGTPTPLWQAPEVERWRLTERPYGAVDETWARAGDGNIAAESPALYFEPVFAQAPRGAPPSGSQSPCRHELRIRYQGGATQVVGTLAEAVVEVPGPPGIAHILEIRSSHAGVRIAGVEGAPPLAGESARHLLGAGLEARIRFTSLSAGRGGIEVRLVGELEETASPARGNAVASGP